MKIPHWIKTKRFIIPAVVIVIVAGVAVRNNASGPEQVVAGDQVKKVHTVEIAKQDTVESFLELKGTILPREYTRIRGLVSANVQYMLPIGTNVRVGDQVAVLSDSRITESFFAAQQSYSDSERNLVETQALNIEALNQAQLGVNAARNSQVVAESNVITTTQLNDQAMVSAEEAARISYQSAYNTMEEVLRYWSNGVIVDFILEDTQTSNQELLKEGNDQFLLLKDSFATIPSKPQGDVTTAITSLQPRLEEVQDFNETVLRVLNHSISNASEGFSETTIATHKQRASGFVSQMNVAETSLRGSKNALVNAAISNKSKMLVADNQLLQANIQLDNALASQESAKRQADIREIGANGQKSAAQVQLASASSQYNDLSLEAPFSGVVIAHRASEGDQVSPGQELVELGQIEGVEIELAIDGTQADLLSVGQEVALTDTITGRITEISPAASLTTGKVNFTVAADNPGGVLPVGDVATVRIPLIVEKSDVIVLPLSNVTIAQSETFVLVIEDGIVTKRPVVIGDILNTVVVIEEGLVEGDVVIAKNGDFLNIGDKVEAHIEVKE